MVIEYSRTPSNAMSNIKKGRKKNTIIKKTNIDEYVSTVIPCLDSENEDKSEDEDSGDENLDNDTDDENQEDQEDEKQ
ncbi:hypothetical protein [Parasitella parasitica]|uniref:Uncharacterized protein n=1 Tax=Parasitella parasitica TaxID=35722 RepID=A0A0B7MW14_9FUNG|nr:hypothetical protein [Parasitella parasitica]